MGHSGQGREHGVEGTGDKDGGKRRHYRGNCHRVRSIEGCITDTHLNFIYIVPG